MIVHKRDRLASETPKRDLQDREVLLQYIAGPTQDAASYEITAAIV